MEEIQLTSNWVDLVRGNLMIVGMLVILAASVWRCKK